MSRPTAAFAAVSPAEAPIDPSAAFSFSFMQISRAWGANFPDDRSRSASIDISRRVTGSSNFASASRLT